jgi:hypothetical protein
MNPELKIFSLDHWSGVLEGDRWSGRTQSPVSYSPEQAQHAAIASPQLGEVFRAQRREDGVARERQLLKFGFRRRSATLLPEGT